MKKKTDPSREPNRLDPQRHVEPSAEEVEVLREFEQHLKAALTRLFAISEDSYRAEYILYQASTVYLSTFGIHLEEGVLPVLPIDLPDMSEDWPEFVKATLSLKRDLKR